MKFSALLLGASLLLPVFAFAQEAAAPAPEAPAQEVVKPAKKMRQMPRRPECKNPDCACMKAFAARPKMERPAKKFSEMTEEERAAFRETMKAQREAYKKQFEEAKAACTCEDCFCKKGPSMVRPRMQMRDRKARGPKGPRGKGPRGPRPAAPAPAAPAAE